MIIAVTNQKGGVGKTTTCLNLGVIAALDHKRTCLIDLDPQGNLTKTLTKLQEDQPTVYNLLNNSTPLPEILVETSFKNLYLAPSDITLAGLERSSAYNMEVFYRLDEQLRLHVKNFDLVIIDTPPTLGALTVNAMTAATHVLIPIQSSFYSLHGTRDFLDTYHLVKNTFNKNIKLLGVLVTMYDPRTTLSREVQAEIQKAFGEKVCSIAINRSVKLEESPAAGQSIITYAPRSKAAQEYQAVYRELIANG